MMLRRRDLLRGMSAAGAGALAGWHPERAAAEPPPETTRLRILKSTSMCWAPQYVAEDLLRAEGFTDLAYVDFDIGLPVSLARSAITPTSA
jgi:NitT/TauT family transport system substrate-binding protein